MILPGSGRRKISFVRGDKSGLRPPRAAWLSNRSRNISPPGSMRFTAKIRARSSREPSAPLKPRSCHCHRRGDRVSPPSAKSEHNNTTPQTRSAGVLFFFCSQLPGGSCKERHFRLFLLLHPPVEAVSALHPAAELHTGTRTESMNRRTEAGKQAHTQTHNRNSV